MNFSFIAPPATPVRGMSAGRLAGDLCLAAALALAADGAAAQQCPDPPGNPAADGDRVECIEDSSFTGDIVINLEDFDIATQNDATHSVAANHGGNGDVRVDVRGGSIETAGRNAYAISGFHAADGDIVIGLRGASIETKHGGARGVIAWKYGTSGTGDIAIDVTNGASIDTEGVDAQGILGQNDGTSGTGDITVGVSGGASVYTAGAGAHGVHAVHRSGEGAMAVTVGAGASVRATGAGASGVQIGGFNTNLSDSIPDGTLEGAAKVGTDGYRQQSVTANGSVYGGSGEAAGVYLAGGGKVFIGPQGTVGAASGIAIVAARKLDTDPAPALYVGLSPGSRAIADMLGDDWILNDGGKTTIVMNGVVLHDGTKGATGLWAPNGARDVTLRKEGVKVTDRTTPGAFATEAWTVVADRDFSAADFSDRYGPRAAVYEALPGFLLRLDGRGGFAGRRGPARSADEPLWDRVDVWGRVEAGRGSYEAARSTVGAHYDFGRYAAETGWTVRLAEGLTGSLGVRLVSGSGDTSAPTGGGEIHARGRGLVAGLSWRGAAGVYSAARASATWYDLDLSSSARGALEGDTGAFVNAFGLEAGRGFALDGDTRFVARGWLAGSEASVDGFTDAVGTRVSAVDAGLLAAGLGGTVETSLALEGGRSAVLRGSLGAERVLDGSETVVHVSGEALRSKAPADRVLLDLEAIMPLAGGALQAGFVAHGLGSDDEEYAASLGFRIAF